MKPRKTYDDTSDSQVATSSSNYMPCRVCHGSTPKAMLTQYGAQCHSCFENWCSAANRGIGPVIRTREQKTALLQKLRQIASAPKADRAWVTALLDRQERGERFGRAQRLMLESAAGRTAK